MTKTLEERFWAKVDRGAGGGCWLWTASLDRDGYGQIRARNEEGRWYKAKAHRVSFELHIGVLGGAHVDHTCTNRACVNPRHLQPVTPIENTKLGADRRTHCGKGHPKSDANTYVWKGRKYCVPCRKEYKRGVRSR